MNNQNWVTFCESSLEVLRLMGRKFYTCLIDPEKDYQINIYPFNSENEALELLNTNGGTIDYILEDDEVLQELACGVELIQARILL
ncbi:MAG: hypothetical protein K0S44_1160 [Bacteroidetes bacterium]|jgi:hypothetical protein|nr:hypothetical protein [Bacteroidota bacterium]